MKLTVEEKILIKTFSETYNTLKERIMNEGFLLLHEIDTQQIVSEYDIEIKPLKQLLFFEPKYISQIMSKDYLAINDIPLKFVIKHLDDDTTSISYQNPAKNLLGYNLNSDMGDELLDRIHNILEF